ncbi:MAG: DUF1778 domain-containing protein [Fuerstia sp.]|jgi:uncharacterized protein (DUF1778 family)|nr:DUF1778 domain-containing protein [Fuerstiella sp.]
MANASESKPTRLNIRISQHEKDVIARAAMTLNTTVSSFVLEKAYDEAKAILADQSQFQLSESQWRKFRAALDAPPKKITALRKLFSESGVFDE